MNRFILAPLLCTNLHTVVGDKTLTTFIQIVESNAGVT